MIAGFTSTVYSPAFVIASPTQHENSNCVPSVGFPKASFVIMLREKEEPAVSTRSNSASHPAGSVGAGCTLTWKDPLLRVWGF